LAIFFLFLSGLRSELNAQNVFLKREFNSLLIANKDRTIKIPKGFFTEIEVNKKNSVELKNILLDKIVMPVMKGEVVDIDIGKPKRFNDFLISKYCQERKKLANYYFRNECTEAFYGEGSKTELIVFPVKFKIKDDYWAYILDTLSDLSDKKFFVTEPHPLNIPLIENDCNGCYGKYSPKSLNSRLPFEFAKYYDTWSGRRRYKSLDYFQLDLSQSEDYGISLVDKKFDKYNLYFFKDILRQLKNEMGIREISKNDQAKNCHPLLSRLSNYFADCKGEIHKYFNPLEIKFVDSGGNSVRKRIFEVYDYQFYLKSFNDFCPDGGSTEKNSIGVFCRSMGSLPYSLFNPDDGIIESEKHFMMFITLDRETMSKTKKIVISHIERDSIK